jgi:hypothetical protein
MNTLALRKAMGTGIRTMQERFLEVGVVCTLVGTAGFLLNQFVPLGAEVGAIDWSLETIFLSKLAIHILWICVTLYIMTALGLAVHGNAPMRFSSWKVRAMPLVIVGGLLFYLGMALGFVLLIIPGVLFALAYSLFAVAMLDKDLSIIAAYKESARLTKDYRGEIFGFNFIAGLILVALMVGFGFVFGVWSSFMPFGVNMTLLLFTTQVLGAAIILWMVIGYIDIYRQLQTIKGTQDTAL